MPYEVKFKTGQVVNFEKPPTAEDIANVEQTNGWTPQPTQPTQPTPEKGGIWQSVKNVGSAVGTAFGGGPEGVGSKLIEDVKAGAQDISTGLAKNEGDKSLWWNVEKRFF